MRNFNFLLFIFLFNLIFCQSYTDVTSVSGVTSIQMLSDSFGSGASIVDFDNDGDLDFYVGTEFGLNNRLYENNGSGIFIEVSTALGISSTYRNRASLWIDYNGDSLLDLVLLGDCRGFDESCTDRIVITIFEQMSNGGFTEVSSSGLNFGQKYSLPNVSDISVSGGLAAADINNDGWLDLLVTIWDTRSDGAKMTLFLNNSGNNFTDVSTTSFPNQLSASRYQPIFHDFDDDGLMDFYVSIDFTANEYWRNKGNNIFEEISGNIGVDSAFNEMGLTLGDYDNDGDFDMYATNISRIDPTEGNQRHNVLFKNHWSDTGALGFSEVSESLGVDQSGWDWGTTFFDGNNDGWIDLAATNGYDPEGWQPDNSNLWLNVEGLFFTNSSSSSNFNDSEYGACLLAFDKDRDGDLDLLQTIKITGNGMKPVRILENNYSSTTNANNYLVVKPRMNGTNHYAIGAVIKISYDGGKTGMRLITAGTSFYGQEPAEAFFGLADNLTVDEITIEWPDNTTTVLNDIAANQLITVTNDNVLEIENFETVQFRVFPNPTSNMVTIKGNEIIQKVEVFDLLGQRILERKTDAKNLELDMSSFSSGNYFIKIQDSKSDSQTLRVIKK